jgi:predicted phage terminase large subunit-like protein
MSPLSTATISGQPGPQTEFLRTAADICVYGGAAGGGKTVGLILEPLRHVGRVANFTAVFFRRTTPQITNPGGLWDESQNFYPRLGGTPHLGAREWRWPRAGKIKFSHLQFETTVYDWQGAQIALICFDELTHFTAHQFFYMVSRNRSTCGVKPYIRATCNPDADSWVADFLAWWIDRETGLPIPERAGVVRYFIRVAEKLVWADKPEELMQDLPPPGDLPPGIELPRAISVTFIPAKVFDNPALLQVNPEYLAWLLSLPLLERERLLSGNWKIRPAAGLYFKREWCAVVDEVPADLDVVRYWDLAATEKTEFNDPDWTVGIKLGRDKNGGYWLLDMVRGRANPGDIDRLLLNTATQDSNRVRVGFGKDPGQAGKSQALHLVRALSGFTVVAAPESGDKLTRFGPFSSQCRAGNVKIRRGSWNEELFRVLEGFPELAHDDEVDACSFLGCIGGRAPPHVIAESEGSNAGFPTGLATQRRRRKPDLNHRSRATQAFEIGFVGRIRASRKVGVNENDNTKTPGAFAGPMVRIRLPPAASLLRMDRCAGEARQSLARQQIARATSAAGSVPRQ